MDYRFFHYRSNMHFLYIKPSAFEKILYLQRHLCERKEEAWLSIKIFKEQSLNFSFFLVDISLLFSKSVL